MNTTEVQGGSPEAASLLKYIAEREDNLSRYSDKLRQSVMTIFNQFGYAKYCVVCGEDKFEHDNFPQKFNHAFVPKIQVSIGLKSKHFRSFTLANSDPEHPVEVTLYLEMPADSPYIRVVKEEAYEGEIMNYTTFPIERVGRETIKALISSGELIFFLTELSKKLDAVGEEYKEVAERAERMAQAIS